MGYMMLTAPCFCCKRIFCANPHRVPSYQNEPICKPCILNVNERRIKEGREPWPVHADAYEPAECD